MTGGWEDLNWAQRASLGMQGVTGGMYNANLNQENAQTARIQATTMAIEDEVRRRQADDFAQSLVEQRLGLPPGGYKSEMFQSALEQQRLGNQIETTQLGILQDKLKKAQEDPIDYIMGRLYHKLADKGVLMDDPDELRQYATTQNKINNALQAQAFQRDQALENLVAQAEAQTGAPLGIAAKRQAGMTLDSLTNKFGVPPDQAMAMVGQSFLGGMGMPAPSPMPVSPEYLSAVGEKVARNAASPEQIQTIRDYVSRQAAGVFNVEPPNPDLKATLAKYGITSDADFQRLSRDKADRFIRSVIRREKLKPVGMSEFLQAIGLYTPTPPTKPEALP